MLFGGPVTVAMGIVHTCRLVDKNYARNNSFGSGWAPFGIATICLAPVVGGIIGANILDRD